MRHYRDIFKKLFLMREQYWSGFQGWTHSLILDLVHWTDDLHLTHVWHNFPILLNSKHTIQQQPCKLGHPSYFWLLQTSISLSEWFTTDRSYKLSGQLVQLDGEKPSRLLVLAVPTPWFTTPVFSIIVSFRLHRLMIRNSFPNITVSPLTIGESPAPSKQGPDP